MVLVLIEAAMYGIGMYGCTALYGIGEVHRRRRAQRMRSKTSNTAIDLCPLPPFTMIHTAPVFTESFSGVAGHSLQLMHGSK